jgi:hypothetical protein
MTYLNDGVILQSTHQILKYLTKHEELEIANFECNKMLILKCEKLRRKRVLTGRPLSNANGIFMYEYSITDKGIKLLNKLNEKSQAIQIEVDGYAIFVTNKMNPNGYIREIITYGEHGTYFGKEGETFNSAKNRVNYCRVMDKAQGNKTQIKKVKILLTVPAPKEKK